MGFNYISSWSLPFFLLLEPIDFCILSVIELILPSHRVSLKNKECLQLRKLCQWLSRSRMFARWPSLHIWENVWFSQIEKIGCAILDYQVKISHQGMICWWHVNNCLPELNLPIWSLIIKQPSWLYSFPYPFCTISVHLVYSYIHNNSNHFYFGANDESHSFTFKCI